MPKLFLSVKPYLLNFHNFLVGGGHKILVGPFYSKQAQNLTENEKWDMRNWLKYYEGGPVQQQDQQKPRKKYQQTNSQKYGQVDINK